MTAPLGWLQKNKQTFQPPLPKRFSQAIDAIGYGCLEKVSLRYPKLNSVNLLTVSRSILPFQRLSG
jgi:hypothetical protein